MREWERWESDWNLENIKTSWRNQFIQREYRKNPRYIYTAGHIASMGGSILDIGCGGGLLYAALREIDESIYFIGFTRNLYH